MKSDLLPGLDLVAGFPVSTRKSSIGGTRLPLGRLTSNPDLYARRWDDFTSRVERFARALSRDRRETVARRSRFYSMPYLRRSDDFDPADFLP